MGQLVAMRVAADTKSRDVAAEKTFELRFRAEGQRSHRGVQSVRADDHVEVLAGSVGERHDRSGAIALDPDDRDAEAGWNPVASFEEGAGQV